MEEWIKGNFRKSIYQNESGYVIGIFKVKEASSESLINYVGRTITFTGYFSDLNTNDTYLFYGKEIIHERYGNQFQVNHYEVVLPEEKDGIVEFLSSELFKGLGEKKAKTIVDVLGRDTLKIILETPSNLLLVPGVNEKLAGQIHDTLESYQNSYETIIWLSSLGFSSKDAIRIYNRYRSMTKDKVEENIYRLTEDFEDITFSKIDPIFCSMGNQRDDTRRIQAAILFTTDEVCNLYGHSYLLKEEMFQYVVRALKNQIAPSEFENALNTLLTDAKMIKREEKYYLAKMFDAEKMIATRFRYLSNLSKVSCDDIEPLIESLEGDLSISYNQDQKRAIETALTNHLTVITGGPGTGKTTIIKAITRIYQMLYHCSYQDMEEEVALLAPTGRAAKRISEATLMPAQTIHRFLKWNKELNRFAVNEYAKSDVRFVIIDEASMVDTYLFDHLLKGLSVQTRIVLVGDANQLPSVGPGEVLKDTIESGEVTVVKLNELYRQGEDSNIISLAYDINRGVVNDSIFNQQPDLTFIPCDSMVVKENLMKYCISLKKERTDFQVLAPMYKTINGIDNLNLILQSVFNPKDSRKNEIIINGITFREDDKVIELSNMPEENIFNGDIGYIASIKNGEHKEVQIDFDGNVVKFTPLNFNKFKHAYAISIHKSQGSEFDTVIMPIVKSYNKMLYRKLIYTGVTRAKKKLVLIGEIDALDMAVQNNLSDERRTSLKEMLNRRIK